MEEDILKLIVAENPELCRSIIACPEHDSRRNFLTKSSFKITSPYAQLIYAQGNSPPYTSYQVFKRKPKFKTSHKLSR